DGAVPGPLAPCGIRGTAPRPRIRRRRGCTAPVLPPPSPLLRPADPAPAGAQARCPPGSSLAARPLGWSEEVQGLEALPKVEEAVLQTRGDEEHRPRLDLLLLGPDPEATAATHHHVDLVLGVGLLWIDGSGLQHVQAGTEVGHSQELEVAAVRGASS